ncbi:MAG: aldolase/citrate lyase family protein [Chloroflexota bacterium]|nr:aldolase/citrate lyase family protein [Chloroflexota bacterium]
MRTNVVKQRLNNGDLVLGTMIFEFSTSGIGRIVAAAGAEFVIFDMEHTGWSMETIRGLLAVSRAAETVPMVRVPATEYHFIAQALDLGAMGVMAPMVESGEQAARIVAASKYPPDGVRGAAFGISHDDYVLGDISTTMRRANDEGLIIAQIETLAGLEHAAEIAGTAGIDVIWIGQFDLTTSLGVPGQMDHPKYVAAEATILEACVRAGKSVAVMTSDLSSAHAAIERGFRMIAYGGDLWLFGAALKDGLDELRESRGH